MKAVATAIVVFPGSRCKFSQMHNKLVDRAELDVDATAFSRFLNFSQLAGHLLARLIDLQGSPCCCHGSQLHFPRHSSAEINQ
jgi:hypothetical protein